MATEGMNGNKRRTSVSIDMLREVIDGRTYEEVAARFGVTRTAVERRAKAVALRLCREVGVEGLSLGGASSRAGCASGAKRFIVPSSFEPDSTPVPPKERILTAEEIARAVVRIRVEPAAPARCGAVLHAVRDRPAAPRGGAAAAWRLPACRRQRSPRVRIASAGSDQRQGSPAVLPQRPSRRGPRCLPEKRVTSGHALGRPDVYRGLDPASRLFLGLAGEPYPITCHGDPAQGRHICRALLEIYRRLFRYADIDGMSTQSARLTLMSRMYARCADEDQVGVILGIADRCAVRELLPRPKPRLAELLDEVV